MLVMKYVRSIVGNQQILLLSNYMLIKASESIL